MSYVSLARKYRPRRFIDMVGQEASTLALTNAIRLGREPHSVIFTGVRGIGKTTSARLYAKALNCEQGPTAEPCDACLSCAAIAAGNHEDVLEIDGASNTGVDDVRALQETLGYVPQRSTYKIYIIDEVHMLSISAFNALLKTLEEPPRHVIFIFATTELQKVPETIQSRCQIFHLQKISRLVITERLRSILQTEQISFEEPAVALIAREGRGSLRDALSMLDQAIAVGDGLVSMEALRHMIGGSQALPVLQILEALLLKDAQIILQIIARWDQEGLAMSTLVEDLAKASRNAFILRDLKGQAIDLQILELEDREQQALLEIAQKAAPFDLNRLFRQLMKCLDDLRHADLDRFVLENYCLEWCFDPGLPDLQALQNLLSVGAAAIPPPVSRPMAQAETAPVNLKERWKSSGMPTVSGQKIPAPASLVDESPRPEVNPSSSITPMSGSKLAESPKTVAVSADSKVKRDVGGIADLPLPLPISAQAVEAGGPLQRLQKMSKSIVSAQEAAKPEVMQVSEASIEHEQGFPREWRNFVDEWKKQKPLQGRILEEAYMLEYSAKHIKLAVDPQSMAGGKLLQQDVRKRLLEQFAQVFGYRGQLEVIARVEAGSVPQPGVMADVHQSENLLTVKSREREVLREKLRQQIEEHPMTREVISQFGGTIEQIELQ